MPQQIQLHGKTSNQSISNIITLVWNADLITLF